MLICLRLIHILFGVFWAGTAMFNAAFLIPAVRALGPAGGPVMQEIAGKRKLPVYFLVAGLLTVLSGFGLYWHDSQGFTNGFMRSAGGMTFGIGAVFALIAVVLGIFVVTPAAMRTGKLAAAIAAGGGDAAGAGNVRQDGAGGRQSPHAHDHCHGGGALRLVGIDRSLQRRDRSPIAAAVC